MYNRRTFMELSGSVWAGALCGAPADAESQAAREDAGGPGLDLSDLPNCCAHEHWGSLDVIGRSSEGYRADTEAGALPTRAGQCLGLGARSLFRRLA